MESPSVKIHNFIVKHLDKLWTLMIGKVTYVDHANMRCKVRVKLRTSTGDTNVIIDVPVVYPKSGGNVILTPIAADDVVLLGFSKFALDDLLIDEVIVNEESMFENVQFSVSEAMILGGFVLGSELGETIFDSEDYEIPVDKIVMIAQGPVKLGKYFHVLEYGATPSPLVNGDMWKDGGVMWVRSNGKTYPLGSESEKTWAFMSRDANTGTNYIGGFYKHSPSSNDFSGGPTFGTANTSYAAHFFVVLGAATVDVLTIRVTGTSITDAGVRTTSDTEDIVIPNGTGVDAYYETVKKWLGIITITVVSGTAKICDYGLCKYWDSNNTDFKVVGFEATWLGAKNDPTPDIKLLHHIGTAGNTDWTYTGSGATPPTPIASMATDHNTEIQIKTDEEGAWKRDNLDVDINGEGSSGTIIELITTTNRTYAIGNFLLRIKPQ